jgi:polysaccharide biosynthesis/export protein
MKVIRTLMLVFVAAGAWAQAGLKDAAFDNYTIKTGDILNILILPSEELSREVIVQKDGNINLALVGDIKAAGATIKELTEKIRLELGRFVNNPQVSVTLKEFGTKKIYIMGQARAPGVYEYKDGMKLLELMSIAGGYTNDAELANIKVFRGKEKKDIIEVNMNDVIDRGQLEKNLDLMADDIVYIPQKGLSAFNWFTNNILPGLYLLTSAVTIMLLVKQ